MQVGLVLTASTQYGVYLRCAAEWLLVLQSCGSCCPKMRPDFKYDRFLQRHRAVTTTMPSHLLYLASCVCLPCAEARGGLHVVEQSLWAAVPSFLRRLSTALKKHTGRELPLRATPIKFGSWMGGDRDGNPNVTAKTTHHVVALSRCTRAASTYKLLSYAKC